MPIPAAGDAQDGTSVVLALFRQLHRELREEVSGLDAAGLNWVPTVGANSIATIVTHVVGSESETLRSLAGLPCERDRDAEFQHAESTPDEIIALLGEADDFLVVVEPLIDGERLESSLSLPTLPAEEARPGLTWLLGNYGHAREHLGQVQLTSQLHRSGPTSAST